MGSKRIPEWKQDHNFFGLDPEKLPIDELDKQVLCILLENSRMSNTEIAKRLSVNESTVRRRIDSLVSRGIIKGFTVCLCNPDTKAGVRAFIYAKIETLALDDVVKGLCDSVNTLSVYRIVGPYDVICEMVFDTMGELHRFYDDLFKRSEVQDIMAHIVVNCYKVFPLLPSD